MFDVGRLGGSIPAAVLLVFAAAPAATDEAGPAPGPLERRYEDGETFRYVMKGSNRNRDRERLYTAECDVAVVRGEDGVRREEVRWTRLEVDGKEVDLPVGDSPHQVVSLDPGFTIGIPDLAGVHPRLIGPMLDLMTFYVDLHEDLHGNKLRRAGDEAFVAHGKPNSWADGQRVLVGEDCIDFALSLERADDAGATLVVCHVPPEEAGLEFPAGWMEERVGERPNNWMQVTKVQAGGETLYLAGVGRETFEVRLDVDSAGRLLRATMDNPVDVRERECTDVGLSDCCALREYRIHRRIELQRVE